MKIKIFVKAHLDSLVICTFLIFSIFSSTLYSQDMVHVVQKGDTLWGICEKYYGDADLWPKLWQMNPYITNPHLLEPGDEIILFEKPTVTKTETPPAEEKISDQEEFEVPVTEGVDVGGIANIATIGYLSLGNIQTSGTIISSESKKLILGEGETVFIVFNQGINPKKGDEYIVIRPSPLLKDPITNQKLGYTFAIHGILTIQEKSGEVLFRNQISDKPNTYKAEIVQSFEPVNVGDEIMPYEPVSSCVFPSPSKEEFLGNIVAIQNQQKILSKGTVVYLNKGFNHGILRGNLFDIVRINIMKDPKPDQPVYPIDDDPILILPDVPVGALLILESRADTSTGIIVHAEEDMKNGAYIKTMSEDRYSHILSLLAKCPIE